MTPLRAILFWPWETFDWGKKRKRKIDTEREMEYKIKRKRRRRINEGKDSEWDRIWDR
jgi:hypothetical protein